MKSIRSISEDGLRGIVKVMREIGVARIVDRGDNGFEVELFDTVPAPPSFESTPEDEPEPKLPTQCIAPGCTQVNGWSFDSRYCAEHGRAAAGVRR